MSFVNETKSTPIQNDTGANVRSDINSNMAAIYSLNASSSEPSAANSVARMIWADESNNELKIRNGTNTSFITVGSLNETNLGLATIASPTFTGNVTVPAGTVSSLPISFTGDTNTGFFKNSADDFSIVTGGARRAHFDSNGITIRDRKALRLRDTSNSNFVAIQAPSNVASDITLTLPSSDGNANDVLQSDGSGNLSFTALPQAVPTGSVHMMATTTAPSGYLKCNGAAVSRTTYADLFAIVGTTWGEGNGSSTFNVPDLRGEFVRGWADNGSVDSGRSFASSQSDQNQQHNHTATATSTVTDPGHFHDVPYSNSDSGDGVIEESGTGFSGVEPTNSATTGISVSTSVSIANSGGSEARPRNIAMMYVIKT
ncbi:phage collar domain containing protein [uncultured Mediterranean phage uvMED]|nr:phage collar domain containing protein [uncultured Mediterranean phage uvMED]